MRPPTGMNAVRSCNALSASESGLRGLVTERTTRSYRPIVLLSLQVPGRIQALVPFRPFVLILVLTSGGLVRVDPPTLGTKYRAAKRPKTAQRSVFLYMSSSRQM